MDLAQIISQLTPANRQLAEQLIVQLARRDGINVEQTELPELALSIDLWVVQMATEGKSPQTIHMYETDVRHYLAKDPHPTSLSIQAYIGKRLKSVTPSRVNTEQKALKSFFKFVTRHGLWATNPCADMTLMRGTEKETECPTDEEILALISYKTYRHANEVKYRMMLLLLINTGFRRSEACSIKKQNISLKKMEIKVLGKGNKERTVPISPFITGLLEAYMEQYPSPNSPYLFPGGTKEGCWSGDAFWLTLKIACLKLGIRPLHPHSLRHYFASKTLSHGAKLEVISRILGHSSVAITADIYRHIELNEFHEEHTKHDPLTQLHMRPQLMAGEEKTDA